MKRWMIWLVIAVAAGVCLAAMQTLRTGSPPADPLGPAVDDVNLLHPDPRYGPQDVVRLQLEALRVNDESDGGIAAAFRFASPANRAQIGSVEQFVRVVRSPAYRAMVNHLSAVADDIQVEGQRAQQVVVITGRNRDVAMYVFLLSRQEGGDFDGCWMTDGVMRVEASGPPAEDEPSDPPAAPRPWRDDSAPMKGYDLPV